MTVRLLLRLILLCVLLTQLCIPHQAKAQNFNQILYQAYLLGDMDAWEQAMNQVDVAGLSEDGQFEWVLAHYGFVGYCLGVDQKDRGRYYLDQGEELAQRLLEHKPENPAYMAVRGAYYGLRIAYQPQKAMIFGPKALKLVNQANKIAPNLPEALIEAGNKDWWMPVIFGGSKSRAIASYEKAIRRMTLEPRYTQENWYYLNAQVILADWYMVQENRPKAESIYNSLLKSEPQFDWVTSKLKNIR